MFGVYYLARMIVFIPDPSEIYINDNVFNKVEKYTKMFSHDH